MLIPGAASLLAAALVLTAQPTPFALPENVERRPVVIWSEGTRLAADLYLPKERAAGTKLPAVILCHGWGGVKADLQRLSARLAQQGFIALAFDYRGWGESDSKLVLLEKMPKPDEKGEVTVRARAIREVVDPFDQALDIQHAIYWLVGEPGVDRDRIGLWGSSYGGGLVTWVAARDPRVKCVAAQVAGMGVQSDAARQFGRGRATQQARGEIAPVPQGYDQVRGLRGYAHVARMADYDAVAAARQVNVPILFVDAENEELFNRLEHAKRAHDLIAAKGTVPTEYQVLKGITHYGVYREAFEEATKLEIDWFRRYLMAPPAAP